MSNPNDFVIENGVLKNYRGPGGDVVVPEGVTSIGDSAFKDCSSLTSVTLPEGVTSIGNEAFRLCHALADANGFVIVKGVLYDYTGPGGDVVIPDGVTSIGRSAFYDCRSLTSITLPEGVTSIGDWAFEDCRSLTGITLPEGVTNIGGYAFSGCRSLTGITLPESVTSIGDGAFWRCSSLTSVTLPEGVTSIGNSAFSGCSSLTGITLPEGVTSIGDSAFEDCRSLKSITLPKSMTSIGDSAFYGCKKLTSITLPEGVTSIGYSAFKDCRILKSITLPKSMTSIGKEAFYGCKKLTSVTLPEGVTSIGSYAFSDCSSLKSITLPEGVTSIGDRAFWGCDSLTSVTIPDSVMSIGGSAFSSCEKVRFSISAEAASRPQNFKIENGVLKKYTGPGGDVVVPEGVTSIDESAFYDCRSLTSVTLPEGVTSIGDRAFYDCSSLTSVTLPESVTSIGSWAFFGCKELADEAGFVIVKGVLFDYFGPGGDAVVPEGVTSISSWAFSHCSSLTSVTLPEGVTSIGDYAFFWCSSLTSVTLPESVTSIGDRAFEGCYRLTSVTLPESVTSIGGSTFKDCYRLTSVTLPKSMTSIGDDTFKDCSSLTSVTLPEGKDATWLVELDPKGQLSGCFTVMDELCKTAGEEAMSQLIQRAKKWPSKWKKVFFKSYLHSDTRAAMLLADQRGEFAQYAALRNADEDELRDRMLSDLGLDANRCKQYDLGSQTVTVRLLPDFAIRLEQADGKVLKSLPKKGADPEQFARAKADLAQMKKDVVKIWKNRADVLLKDFLSGRERTAAYWTRTYGGNPILHAVACLLVWQQGGVCFARTDAGTVLADGTPYALTEAPIRLAHPMELPKQEVEAWQHYFTAHGLKQPFEQIWEPVEEPSLVLPGRYDGCTIPQYMLMNKEKHGIIMEGQKKLTLRDCSAELEFIQGHHDWINNEYEVKNFRFQEYTRQVNHIVVHFDKGTVAGRIKKDDITAARWFDRFTLAQITEFISAAQEANATNVLAALLEYKNKTFPDFDPMDEFTLEW